MSTYAALPLRRAAGSGSPLPAAPEQPQQSPETKSTTKWPAVVAALTFAVYLPVLSFQFVYDDQVQILHNPRVQAWSYVPAYFTQHVWAHLARAGSYYRPLFLLWLRVNDAVFGFNAAGWHLTSLMAHVVTTLLVYVLTARLLRQRTAAAFAGLMFGLHPVHIECVSWISAASELALAGLMIASLIVFQKRTEEGENPSFYTMVSLLLFFAALLMKETAIAQVAIVFSYVLLVEEGGAKGSWISRLVSAGLSTVPFAVVGLVYFGIRARALANVAPALNLTPRSTAFLTSPYLMWFYLRHLAWPWGVSVFYDMPLVEQWGASFVLPLAGIAGVTATVGYALQRLSRNFRDFAEGREWLRTAWFAAAWMVLPLLPVLNIRMLPWNYDFAHDRYLYVPSVGLAILAGMVFQQVSRQPREERLSRGQAALSLGLVALLATGVLLQVGQWKNEFTLYEHGLKTAPHNVTVKSNLAFALTEAGRVEEAMPLLEEAIALDPSYAPAYTHLARCYALRGDVVNAEKYYAESAQRNPIPEVVSKLRAARGLLQERGLR